MYDTKVKVVTVWVGDVTARDDRH